MAQGQVLRRPTRPAEMAAVIPLLRAMLQVLMESSLEQAERVERWYWRVAVCCIHPVETA
jgi:hypothetical protein